MIYQRTILAHTSKMFEATLSKFLSVGWRVVPTTLSMQTKSLFMTDNGEGVYFIVVEKDFNDEPAKV